ncbi:MAG: Crp/Fnr family transcriptional regulator [Coriobacteriia bacterium]
MTKVPALPERVWKAFRQCDAWRNASDDAVVSLARASRYNRYAKNEWITVEGLPADQIAVVVSGSVRAAHHAPAGRIVTVKTAGPGSALGISGAIRQSDHPLSIEACAPSTVALCPMSSLISVISAEPQVMNSLVQACAGETLDALRTVRSLSSDVSTRLASHIMDLVECHDVRNSRERFRRPVVDLGVPRIELASVLGTVPETLSRTFRILENEGIIQAKGRTLVILNREGLAAKACRPLLVEPSQPPADQMVGNS